MILFQHGIIFLLKSSDTSIGVDGLFGLTLTVHPKCQWNDDDSPIRIAKRKATWIPPISLQVFSYKVTDFCEKFVN